jgi:histidinol-phosphatase
MGKSKFLKTAILAAKEAEIIILEHYSTKIKTSRKADRSLATAADEGSEKIIKEIIKKEFPDHGFIGEEFGNENERAQYVWIVDPIDGTNNFVHNIPFFATQIALMKDGKLILGVSNAPVLKELLYAEKGSGAYLNGEKISVSDENEIKNSYMSFGGMKHFEKKNMTSNLVRLATDTHAARGFGDCWSYHFVSQGKIDFMVEAKVKLYDIAALKVIVEEAGGKVTDIEGSPISRNSDSIIASNGKFHSEILKYFKN